MFEYHPLPADAEARIYQPLNDRENYLDYRRMRIFTNGQAQFAAAGPVFDRQPTFFVEFGNDSEARSAIQALSGQEYGGRALTVNEARPKTAGGGGGGGRSGGRDRY